MSLFALIVLSLALGWTATRSGGVLALDWNIALLGLCPAALLRVWHPEAPPLPGALRWPLLLLPIWIAIQMLTSISVAPGATLAQWMRVAGYILVFLTVRELASHYSSNGTPWLLALPLVLIACFEAVLGLLQSYSATGAVARGTYVNRDHFAGLLEMVLPFPLAYGFAAYRSGQSHFASPLRPALTACAAFAAAALIFLGIIQSLSRTGFIVALSVLCMLCASIMRRTWLLAAPLLGMVLFIFLPPEALVSRFSQLTDQTRADMWRETLPLIAAHPISGCGLGGYDSAFMKFKRSRPANTDDYAHNDYLQYMAELGLPAFLLGVLFLGGVVAVAFQAARVHLSLSSRALAVACIASITALLIHSFFDFNSKIPANAFAFSWIAALAVSVPFSKPVGKSLKEEYYV